MIKEQYKRDIFFMLMVIMGIIIHAVVIFMKRGVQTT